MVTKKITKKHIKLPTNLEQNGLIVIKCNFGIKKNLTNTRGTMIIQIIGQAGTGKTALAEALADGINAIHINADKT